MLAAGPIGLEGMDDRLIDDMKRKRPASRSDVELLPEGGGWLLVEFGGETRTRRTSRRARLMDAC